MHINIDGLLFLDNFDTQNFFLTELTLLSFQDT